MTARYDAIVIGGGVNGLTAAACLGRRGLRTLLLERRDAVGGQSRSAEFAPGFRSAPLGLDAGWLPREVASALGLTPPERVLPEATLAVPAGESAWLVLSRELRRSGEAIARYSAADAGAWPGFSERLARHAGVLAALYTLPPPAVDAASLNQLLPLAGVAWKLKRLGKRDMLELLRTVPMSVQELLDDQFETGALKAALAGLAVEDLQQGPRSGGTSFGLLHRQVGSASGAIRGLGFWKAGPGALCDAIAAVARGSGVEIRAGAEVGRILAHDDRVTGVLLADGQEIGGAAVLSSVDPVRTLLGLVDPIWLDPEFLLAVRNIKLRGSSARISYALDGLPEFPGLPEASATLRGALCLSPSLEALERAADAAKYGRISERPQVELQVPSLRWPDLAPAGQHVLVARVQWAPYALREGEWDAARRALLEERVLAAISECAPGFANRIVAREVLAPPDLERRYGLSQGAATQGELTLDQILFMRPVPGAARYATPLAGLYLCGAGSHPGPGIAGAPGWLAARQVLADRRA